MCLNSFFYIRVTKLNFKFFEIFLNFKLYWAFWEIRLVLSVLQPIFFKFQTIETKHNMASVELLPILTDPSAHHFIDITTSHPWSVRLSFNCTVCPSSVMASEHLRPEVGMACSPWFVLQLYANSNFKI